MKISQPSPAPHPIDAEAVKQLELERHIGKQDDEPLFGLALSGGGIRSATFGLGVLQALQSLGLFERLDYVSTVSGGGYIGGWLQAALARGRVTQALDTSGQESHDTRFLRSYSNYLTPKLGLFSGDTWAAIGNALRNLILNFTILSLSLIAPLYLPWLIAAIFWRIVPGLSSGFGALSVIAVLLVLVVSASTANMARPLEDGSWTKSGASQASPLVVYLLVILPALLAMWLGSTVMWAWAREGHFRTGAGIRTVTIEGAVGYGAVWVLGLAIGFFWRQFNGSSEPGRNAGIDIPRAGRAAGVLVVTAMMAGGLGTFLMALASDKLAYALGWTPNAWLIALLSFPLGVVCLMLGATAHIGLAGTQMSDETREWWGRVGGVQLLMALLLIVLGVIALVGPHALLLQWTWLGSHGDTMKSVLGVAWGALTGAGVLAGRSERTSTGAGNPLFEWAGKIAPVAFVFGYLLILATFLHATVPHVTTPSWPNGGYAVFRLCDVESRLRGLSLGRANVPPDAADAGVDADCLSGQAPLGAASELGGLLLMLVTTGALAWFISWRVDLNEFSLHTFYRNRLVRCFLGASRQRRPHPFTGFDGNDDVPLASQPTDDPPRRIRPYPIFNTAINLVAGKNLAWQERKAASFIFTPEYCGFEYRQDQDLDPQEKPETQTKRLSAYAETRRHADDPMSLTMGLAIATSGAAASPNMGYHSSPTLAFLMTVFNVRLGWWLRNPRWPAVWAGKYRHLSLREMLYELLGMTTDDKKWVYLSDGGHFENLALYELVRRRCRFIIACDAGQDGAVTFSDLGNAIEKCRTDFGVDIEIDLDRLHPVAGEGLTGTRRSEWHCAIGTIRYDRQDRNDPDGAAEGPGTLLYLKSSLTGDEPADVLRYAAEHPSFPHESTSDQFFDESQFESYRALGFHIARDVVTSALGSERCRDLQDVEVFTRLRQRWSKPAPAPQDAIRKYSNSLTRIWTTVRTTPELRFLDSQMFPEMPALLGVPFDRPKTEAPVRLPPVNYWLPPSEGERRAGFYACVEMLQLMEDVFLDFALDEHYDHIDNRGWMNLFQHWAWSGMLCATWAMVGSTYDPRFQRFCWTRLDLRPGVPTVTDLDSAVELPAPDQWRAWYAAGGAECVTHMNAWQGSPGLNFWEAELVGKYLRASLRPAERLFPVRVTVESPRRSDGNPLRFNVGYLIGDLARVEGQPARFALQYMRIQNHLRKMGLARDALLALRRTFGVDLAVEEPRIDPAVADGKASDEGLPSLDALRRLRAIVRSLPKV